MKYIIINKQGKRVPRVIREEANKLFNKVFTPAKSDLHEMNSMKFDSNDILDRVTESLHQIGYKTVYSKKKSAGKPFNPKFEYKPKEIDTKYPRKGLPKPDAFKETRRYIFSFESEKGKTIMNGQAIEKALNLIAIDSKKSKWLVLFIPNTVKHKRTIRDIPQKAMERLNVLVQESSLGGVIILSY